MKKITISILMLFCFLSSAIASDGPGSPTLNTNPCLDVIVTRTAPLLSFKNAEGGALPRTYEIELDLSESFNSPSLRKFGIPENTGLISALKIKKESPLIDKKSWNWRVRAIDSAGRKGEWTTSKFYIDSESDDSYSGLQRVYPISAKASSGSNPEFLIDYSDSGLNSQWRASPPGPQSEWIELDLGEPKEISRIWMLSGFENKDGWLTDFHWLTSNDGESWKKINDANISNSNTYRSIIDIKPYKARFWRLEITKFTGYAPALNEVMLFTSGQPEIQNIPTTPYVLVIGNQRNGFTFTRLKERIAELAPQLTIIQIPFWKANMAMFNALPNKPFAIILSGNNADYNKLPMFEYNGEYELIRQAPIPILGICAGCQMNAFAYGYTRVHSMGWSDISAMEIEQSRSKINIKIKDPILENIPNPFIAPEVHGWAIYSLSEEYELLAESDYFQAIRRKDRMRYGVQFHPEIKVSYNQAVPVLKNFLKMALERAKK
ncbi:glutamine amidotransferase-related protein [Desulfovibrio gilichinskyi]|uniref:Anthranilate/para-aminobenzoate synthase component II n=1 Tax=Desulfovibrio gilichinskyi TaxID=1519643 RepID=A0A1X7CKD1_9BACT|nr:discoidin domain-containing protein [Desulfovibrio gilichinskyi]SME98253.1 Anthranilate/para-aminobenzoate synthase component II [Desulfovibrio gilichinskyi]